MEETRLKDVRTAGAGAHWEGKDAYRAEVTSAKTSGCDGHSAMTMWWSEEDSSCVSFPFLASWWQEVSWNLYRVLHSEFHIHTSVRSVPHLTKTQIPKTWN